MIYLSIDPGKVCGVAWRSKFSPTYFTTIKLIDLGLFLSVKKTKVLWWLDGGGTALTVAIEKAKGRWNRLREHKAQANQVKAIIKAIWPRRESRVHFIDPRVWQNAVTSGAPGQTPKERSCYVASEIAGREITDHNEGDAVCQLEYLIKHLVKG